MDKSTDACDSTEEYDGKGWHDRMDKKCRHEKCRADEITVNRIALLFLRARSISEDFYLGVCNVENYCEILLKCLFKEKEKIWLIHVHHTEDSDNQFHEKSFDLVNYCKLLCAFENTYRNSVQLQELSDIDSFEFVIFSESEISEELPCIPFHCPLLEKIFHLSSVCNVLQLNPEHVTRALQNLLLYENFLSDMLQNDSDSSQIMQGIQMLCISLDANDIKKRLCELREMPHKCFLEKLHKEVSIINDNLFCKESLNKLKLYGNQSNISELAKEVKSEVQKLCLSETDCHLLCIYLLEQFEKWWISGCAPLNKQSELCQDFEKKIYRLSQVQKSCLPNIQKVSLRYFPFPTNDIKCALYNYKVLNILASDTDITLSTLKVYQILENFFKNNYFWISFEILHILKEELFNAWPYDRPILVIECVNETDFEAYYDLSCEVSEVLKAFDNTKIILISNGINKFIENLQNRITSYHKINDSFKFIDFDDQSQIDILNTEILFQGQSAPLSLLIGTHQQLKESLSASVIAQLIKVDKLVFGPSLPENSCYIPQKVNLSIAVTINILSSFTQTEIFVVTNVLLPQLKTFLPGEKVHTFHSSTENVDYECKVFCISSSEFAHLFRIFCEHFSNKNVHCFAFQNGTLLWRESKGDTKYLKNYIICNKSSNKTHIWEVMERSKCSTYLPETLLDVAEDVVVLVGEPGSGKSSLLSKLALQTKAAHPKHWIVHLNLNNHTKELSEISEDDCNQDIIFKILFSLLEGKEHTISLMEYTFLKYSLETRGNVIVICDGLDEIGSHLTKKALHFIQVLRKMNVCKVWVASSQYMQHSLEVYFGVVVHELMPLTHDDRRKLFFSLLHSNYEQIPMEEFVTKLESVCKIGRKQEKSLLNTPLFCCMAIDVFTVTDSDSIVSVDWPEIFDITVFYDKYIDKIQHKNSALDAQLHEMFFNRHMRCALLAVCDYEDLKELNLQNTLENVFQFTNGIKEYGLITGITKQKPIFTHHTIAEYFAAMWFSRNLDKCKEFLREQLLTPSFSTIRKFFDNFLTRGYELHTAVLRADKQSIMNLLDCGVDVNAVDKAGRTALHLAIIHSSPILLNHPVKDRDDEMYSDVIKLLINHSANTKMIDDVLFWRPVQYAIELKIWDAMDLLLKEQVDFNDIDCLKEKIHDESFLQEGLLVASQNGYYSLIDCLSACSINTCDNIIQCEGGLYNPLHIAAKYGQLKLVRSLLNKKIKISVRNKKGMTPLHMAASEGMIQVLVYLLQRGADLHCTDKEGNTPLNYTIFKNDLQTVIFFVEQYHCNINLQNKQGDTPLHHSVKYGQVTMVEYILMKGANIHTPNKEGNTGLHLAVWLGKIPTIRLLLEYGANVNFCNKNGDSALSQGAGSGNLQVVKILVENGANVNLQGNDGNAPLHWAVRQDNVTISEYLLRKGADVNIQNKYGNTPLHRAVEQGCLNTTKFLISAGCKQNIRNKAGYTARTIKSRSTEVTALFVE